MNSRINQIPVGHAVLPIHGLSAVKVFLPSPKTLANFPNKSGKVFREKVFAFAQKTRKLRLRKSFSWRIQLRKRKFCKNSRLLRSICGESRKLAFAEFVCMNTQPVYSVQPTQIENFCRLEEKFLRRAANADVVKKKWRRKYIQKLLNEP